jgi:hypothetical protein
VYHVCEPHVNFISLFRQISTDVFHFKNVAYGFRSTGLILFFRNTLSEDI